VPPLVIAAGITAAGAIGSSLIGSHAAHSAADAQTQAAQLGIDEQHREYDQSRSDLLPWLNAGQQGLGGMLGLLGLNGAGAQQSAIDGIQNSPMFASLNRQGEQAILQNASATGGLRGGNVQSSLYNNRADLLAQLIDQQYTRLGALSGAGANVGSTLGGLGQGAANAISGLFGQQGAARAGGTIGAASGFGSALQGVTGLLGNIVGQGGFGGGGTINLAGQVPSFASTLGGGSGIVDLTGPQFASQFTGF
jgi:hypothetical protein